jgi:hypothetical protein
MLTPRQLYIQYSLGPCINSIGAGTPYDLRRLIKFLKHLKYPCIQSAPHATVAPSDSNSLGIQGTGANKIGIPYKFLCKVDPEAFTEIQPSIKSGTSHGIRNACDITRICDIETSTNKDYRTWVSRMATEYIEHYGGNSLPDCLMVLGPDLVSENVAENDRASGCDPMICVPNTSNGAAGAIHGCRTGPGETIPKCKSCGECTSDPPNPFDPCCAPKNCADRINNCCGGGRTTRMDFSYVVPSDDGYFGGDIFSGFVDLILKHVGILVRKSYGGYANFIDNSGSNFYAARDDVFLKYFQTTNGYNYTNDTASTTNQSVQRFRTTAFLNQDTTTKTVNTIKDLLFNGYGVVLMSNVGFPDSRDSTGLSYPDKIWYHTYSIIGYDDTKIEYPECVYILANSFGDWNTGGHPSWGPLPAGSFLVTESHLKGMVSFNQSPSLMGCRGNYCPPPCPPELASLYAGCTEDNSCVPFECSDRQRAFGMAFGLSTSEGFPKRTLNYQQFLPTNNWRLFDNSSALYFDE